MRSLEASFEFLFLSDREEHREVDIGMIQEQNVIENHEQHQVAG